MGSLKRGIQIMWVKTIRLTMARVDLADDSKEGGSSSSPMDESSTYKQPSSAMTSGSTSNLSDPKNRTLDAFARSNDGSEVFENLTREKQERIRLMKDSGYKVEDTEDIIDEEEFGIMKEL